VEDQRRKELPICNKKKETSWTAFKTPYGRKIDGKRRLKRRKQLLDDLKERKCIGI
jgi:ribosomal protein L34